MSREGWWKLLAIILAVLVLAIGGYLCAQGTGGGMGWCEP